MNYAQARAYLLSKPEAIENFPFGPDVAVMKIREKIFATLAPAKGCARMNLKCDPAEAEMLRDIFPAVIPGYHMNKRHWNTVELDGSIPDSEIQRMVDSSFALVVAGLRLRDRQSLEIAHGTAAIYGKTGC